MPSVESLSAPDHRPPPRDTSGTRADGAPVGPTTFLGRKEELAELAGLLERSRLITLTGTPGIGKSRLASQLAEGPAGSHEGGRALVELASVSNGAHVPSVVASALSLKEAPGQSLTDTVVARLGARRSLLVLDNCEHLVKACAELVEALLHGCPQLRVVATSREHLGIAAERVWQVPALSLPGPDEATPEMLMASEAICLFVDRATAVEPGFSLNRYVAPAVAGICRRLDGIPLAIELAAARLELFTPAEIAGRLNDRFNLLTSGVQRVLRHRTMEAALDWSHELLSPAERALFRRLFVFTGDFDLQACEAICPGGEVEAVELSELLRRLVSKSLVLADTSSFPDVRYRLLEVIRAYAGERLEDSGEASSLREAHARFYLKLAEGAEPELTGPDQVRRFEQLERERANLRAGLEWSVGHGHGDWALRLAGSLVVFWRVRCHFSEGRDLLDAALSVGDVEASQLRARALWGAGLMALMADDTDGALPRAEESLELFSELDDSEGQARALLALGGCWQFRDLQRGLSYFQESVARARKADDSWCLVHALTAAGMNLCGLGEQVAARPMFEECLAIGRKSNDQQALRMGLLGLGELAYYEGDYRSAEPLLEEAIAVAEDLGEDYTKATALRFLAAAVGGRDWARAGELLDAAIALLREARPADLIDPLVNRSRVARAQGDRALARHLCDEALARARNSSEYPQPALQNMGELLAEDGDARSARRLLEEALDVACLKGDKRGEARTLHSLGRLERDEGDENRAAALHGEALELQRRIADPRGIVASLEAVAGLAAAGARERQAARLFGAANALREAHGYARYPWEAPPYQADRALLQESLSVRALDAALSQGAALSLEQAMTEASTGEVGAGRLRDGLSTLTKGERRVASLVAEGLTNAQIADRLFITPGTVKNHLSHVFTKLDITSRTELAREVLRNGPSRVPSEHD